jgi:hypothetical protein
MPAARVSSTLILTISDADERTAQLEIDMPGYSHQILEAYGWGIKMDWKQFSASMIGLLATNPLVPRCCEIHGLE